MINKQGLQPNPAKVDAIKCFTVPKTVKQIKSFIGALSYYRNLIRDFSTLSEPLLKLSQKDATFVWKDKQEELLQKLKQNMMFAPILKRFDRFLDVQLKTNGSVI